MRRVSYNIVQLLVLIRNVLKLVFLTIGNFKLKDTEGLSLSVEVGKPWCSFVGDLASICTVKYLLVFYGGEKSVIKILSKEEELRSRPYRSRTCDTLIKSQAIELIC